MALGLCWVLIWLVSEGDFALQHSAIEVQRHHASSPIGGGDNGEAEVDLGVSLHGSVCEPHSTIIALNARGSGRYFQDREVGREGRETLA